ncbi:hypothetical protein MMC10_010925 [Thelotrema lepadinum]|nr:hypothetical protein [Thelotrema lepadinum]
MTPGMAMSRSAFETVEHAFGLHSATITALFRQRGVHSSFVEKKPGSDEVRRLRIVVKATQKLDIGNYLLSLSYDVSTGWINALICGYGMLHEREEDKFFGFQLKQLTDAIISSPMLWSNPLFLPYVAFQIYLQRIEVCSDLRDIDMIELEEKLGVTRAGGARVKARRGEWLEAIDNKEATVGLHSVLIKVGFMSICCKWLKAYAQFLLDLEKQMDADRAFENHAPILFELQESIAFLSCVITGEENHFSNLRDRANSQVNLLFSIVSQQDCILNRKESRLNQIIASSSKQDSISVTTFTFITALFLPGTFIATLFSMTMFDWHPSDDGDSPSSQDSYVSNQFWLFWAIAIPLTVLTMSGWFFWFRYANSRWIQELSKASSSKEDESFSQPSNNQMISQSLINHPGLRPGSRLPICRLGFAQLDEPDLRGASTFCSCHTCSAASKNLYGMVDKSAEPISPNMTHIYGQGG